MVTIVLGAVIAGAVAAGIWLSSRGGEDGAGRWGRPLTWLAVVVAAIYVNQVLFTVYVVRCHGGDPSFISRHVPAGWFVLADGPAVDAVARHFPFPRLLAPTVLRVQAFLELPFVVLAYLTVCRWFSGTVYRAALRLVPAVSVSYTATFCLIEWALRNPYTDDDILIRVVAGLLVPLGTARLGREVPERARDLAGLLVFAASAAAFGMLGLVVYETALLYNLGLLDDRLPMAGLALALLGIARAASRVVPVSAAGPGVGSIAGSFGHFLVLFMVPALPIRYGLGFGTAALSAAAGTALIVLAAWRGTREEFGGPPGRLWGAQMALSSAAGFAGVPASWFVAARYTEARLLFAAAAFFGCAVSVCALIDRHYARASGTISR